MSNQSEPLSRRDKIAIAAMQALIAANNGKSSYLTAEMAVNHADALIKALGTNKQA